MELERLIVIGFLSSILEQKFVSKYFRIENFFWKEVHCKKAGDIHNLEPFYFTTAQHKRTKNNLPNWRTTVEYLEAYFFYINKLPF